MHKDDLLIFAMQGGSEVAFASVKYRPQPDSLTWMYTPPAIVGENGKHNRAGGGIKESQRATAKMLDKGPKNLVIAANRDLTNRAKHSNKLFALAKETGNVEDYIKYNVETSEIYNNYKTNLDYLAKVKVDMDTDYKDNDNIFIVGDNSVLYRTLGEDGKFDGNVNTKPLGRVTKDDSILTYKDARMLLDDTFNPAVGSIIQDNYRNVSSNKTKESAVDKATDGLGKVTATTTLLKTGGKGDKLVVSSLDITNPNGNSTIIQLEGLVDILKYKNLGYVRSKNTNAVENADVLVKQLENTYDPNVIRNYYANALKKVLGQSTLSTSDELNALGNKEMSEAYYNNLLSNIKSISGMYSKPGDMKAVVDKLTNNEGFMKAYGARYGGGDVKKLSSVLQKDLLEELTSVARDVNKGYSFDEALTEAQGDKIQEIQIHNQARIDMVTDVFRRLDLSSSLNDKGGSDQNSGSGGKTTTNMYSPLYFLQNTETVSEYQLNNAANVQYEDNKAFLINKDINYQLKGNYLTINDKADENLINPYDGKVFKKLADTSASYSFNGTKLSRKEVSAMVGNGEYFYVDVPVSQEGSISKTGAKDIKFNTVKTTFALGISNIANDIAEEYLESDGDEDIYEKIYNSNTDDGLSVQKFRLRPMLAEYLLMRKYRTKGDYFKLNKDGIIIAKNKQFNDELRYFNNLVDDNSVKLGGLDKRINTVRESMAGVFTDKYTARWTATDPGTKDRAEMIKTIMDTEVQSKKMLAQKVINTITYAEFKEYKDDLITEHNLFGSDLGNLGASDINDIIAFIGTGELKTKRLKALKAVADRFYTELIDQYDAKKIYDALDDQRTTVEKVIAQGLDIYWKVTRGKDLDSDWSKNNDPLSDEELKANKHYTNNNIIAYIAKASSMINIFSNVNRDHEAISEYYKNEKVILDDKETQKKEHNFKQSVGYSASPRTLSSILNN